MRLVDTLSQGGRLDSLEEEVCFVQVPLSQERKTDNSKKRFALCRYPGLLVERDHIHIHGVMRLEERN